MSLTSIHNPTPLTCLCCQRFLYSTLRLKPVPLTHTGMWRNKLSATVPLITRTASAQNPGIHTSVGNPTSYVQADGNRSMSSAPAGPVPGALVGQKSSVSFPNSKKADPPSSSHRHLHPECPMHPPFPSLWPKLSRP